MVRQNIILSDIFQGNDSHFPPALASGSHVFIPYQLWCQLNHYAYESQGFLYVAIHWMLFPSHIFNVQSISQCDK